MRGRAWLFRILLALIGWSSAGHLTASPGEPIPDTVVVVADRNRTESMALAEAYMQSRGIPEKNLLALSFTGDAETINWRAYYEEVEAPIFAFLEAQDWIEVLELNGFGEGGRPNRMVTRNHVSFLVLLKGVPLRIENDSDLLAEAPAQPKPFSTTRASVDSQLAMLLKTDAQIAGHVRNPFFRKQDPGVAEGIQAIRVCRIDAPSFDACFRLLERTRIAEEKGLRGRAYVDAGGPHPQGDRWLNSAAEKLKSLHFPVTVESSRRLLGAGGRFDAPAFYFGWYSRNPGGVFKLPGLELAPGAIAMHIHSYSATTLRNKNQGWTGPLVEAGAVAAVGNVFEPYLELSHNPGLLIEALAAGMSWGEAAFYSLPALSWQSIVIGDPLYEPFHFSLEAQRKRGPDLIDSLQQYVAIREMNRLDAAGDSAQAMRGGDRWFFDQPGLALALRLARQAQKGGDVEKAKTLLSITQAVRVSAAQETGLVLETVEMMESLGMAGDALAWMQSILRDPALPPAAALPLLTKGMRLASLQGNMTQRLEWNDRYEKLTQ